MAFDVERVRSHFPALAEGAAHFDGPGGTQVPDVVGAAMAETLTAAIANRWHCHRRRAACRTHGRRGPPGDGRSARRRAVRRSSSDAARRSCASTSPARSPSRGGKGDEVVVTRLDHDSNIRPWILAAEAAGATVRWAEFDPTSGDLVPDDVAAVLSERTVLVAVRASGREAARRSPGAGGRAAARPRASRIRACHRRARWHRRDGRPRSASALRTRPRAWRRSTRTATIAAPGRTAWRNQSTHSSGMP